MKPPEACKSIADVRGAIDGLDREMDPDFVESLYRNIVSHFVGREIDGWQEDRT